MDMKVVRISIFSYDEELDLTIRPGGLAQAHSGLKAVRCTIRYNIDSEKSRWIETSAD